MSRSSLLFSRHRAAILLFLAAAVTGAGLGWLGRSVSKTRLSSNPSSSAILTEGQAGDSSSARHSPVSGSLRLAGKDYASAAARMAGLIGNGLSGGKNVSDWLRILAAAENAPPEVLSQLLELLEKENEPAVTRLLATRWAQQDPAGLCARLAARRGKISPGGAADRRRVDLEKILASEWFRQNPDALIQSLDGVAGPWQLRTAKIETLRLLVSRDPERSVKLMLGWRLPLDSVDGDALVTWVRANPRQAASALLRTQRRPDYSGSMDRDRCLILTETAKAWAAADPVGALKMKPEVPGILFDDFQTRVVIEWARRDIAAVTAFLSGKEVNQKQKNDWAQTYPWGDSLLQVWGATDPAAALAWADAQLTGRTRQNAASALIKTLTAQDPQRALEFLNQLPPGSARDKATETVAITALEDKDRAQSLDFFQKLTALNDPGQQAIALQVTAGALLKTVPEEFLAWFKTPEGVQAPYGLLRSTGYNLLHQQNPAAAMDWAAGIRPDVSPSIRQMILEGWIGKDAPAASAWVQALPAGDERARMVSAAAATSDFTITGKLTDWLDTLPASDHPAILEGIQKSENFDAKRKAELMAKYGK